MTKQNTAKKETQEPGLIMCVCNGNCPAFDKLDTYEFINRAREEFPVDHVVIHPQLCAEDGERFMIDYLKGKQKVTVAGCAPNMQQKMFRDAFETAGIDMEKNLVSVDIRGITTDEALEKVRIAVEQLASRGNE